jgi:hypothetical protein
MISLPIANNANKGITSCKHGIISSSLLTLAFAIGMLALGSIERPNSAMLALIPFLLSHAFFKTSLKKNIVE